MEEVLSVIDAIYGDITTWRDRSPTTFDFEVDLPCQFSLQMSGLMNSSSKPTWNVQCYGSKIAASTVTLVREAVTFHLSRLQDEDNIIFETIQVCIDTLNSMKDTMMEATAIADDQIDNAYAVSCIHIDHMNKPKKYLKLLKEWAEQLVVQSYVFMRNLDIETYCKDIYLIVTGTEPSISNFIKNLRTISVDVDKKGRACLERKSTILFRHNLSKKHMNTSNDSDQSSLTLLAYEVMNDLPAFIRRIFGDEEGNRIDGLFSSISGS